MLSIVLYGRNDSYGYNLHKRAAISLNCMAEVLTHADDEIIFVDYNTPDDFPTFPEAIQDTLTDKAKSLLRILRVRPKHHERFRDKTHLVALEPIARNVGIRRSNAQNRWILSTNTDMVFVPRTGRSLSEVVATLPDAYYHLPRFEVPETLWESVNRMDPRQTIESFLRWGKEFHLNEIVYTSHEDVKYDGPGDFQLILRSDLWRIHGFHEEMLLGWHVDSNIARRLSLMPRPLGDVIDDLYGYHCDHTRQVTPAHRASAAQNDQKIYFEHVLRPDVPEQATAWGLAGETIEDLRVETTSRSYVAALEGAIAEPLQRPTTTGYSPTSFNRIDYPSNHVVPFLTDALASYPRGTVLAWSGGKRSLLERFAAAWHSMGFSEPIVVFDEASWLGPQLPAHCVWAPWQATCDRAEAFVFDWGKAEDDTAFDAWVFDRDPIVRRVTRHFRRAIRHERWRVEKSTGVPPRRFIGVNAICNSAEGIFNSTIGAALTPLATHIRQGFLRPVEETQELLASLYIGQAGSKEITGIANLPRTSGCVFYGPYLDLDRGMYRLTVEFSKVSRRAAPSTWLNLEVRSSTRLLACREIDSRDLARGRVTLDFYVSPDVSDALDWPRVEFILSTDGATNFAVGRVALEPIEMPRKIEKFEELEIAPLLVCGSAGKRQGREVHARRGVAELVTYGPYFWLTPGRYEADFRFRVSAGPGAVRAYVAHHLGVEVLGRAAIAPQRSGAVKCVIPFEVSEEAPLREEGLLEFLVSSTGKRNCTLTSLKVKRLRPATARKRGISPDRGILRLMSRQHAGRWFDGAMLAVGDISGPVFRSPRLPLPCGAHRLELSMRSLDSRNAALVETGLTLAALSDGEILGYRRVARSELRRGTVALNFVVPQGGWGRDVDLLLHSSGLCEAQIEAASLTEEAGDVASIDACTVDLLPLCDSASGGSWRVAPTREHCAAIYAAAGKTEVALLGPAIALEPGQFRSTFEVLVPASVSSAKMTAEVVADGEEDATAQHRVLLSADGNRKGLTANRGWKRLTGAVTFDVSASGRRRVRIWSSPKGDFYVVKLRIEKIASASGLRSNGRALAIAQPNGLQRLSTVAR